MITVVENVRFKFLNISKYGISVELCEIVHCNLQNNSTSKTLEQKGKNAVGDDDDGKYTLRVTILIPINIEDYLFQLWNVFFSFSKHFQIPFSFESLEVYWDS